MSERPMDPTEKRATRDAARKGDQVRRQAIREALRARWSGRDADESNWLDAAVQAHPGPEVAVRVLYGLSTRLVDRLVEVTGEDRDKILSEVLG